MNQNLNDRKKRERRIQRAYGALVCVLATAAMMTVPALAADDPLAVVNSLSDFIFSLIRAVGLILLGYGILQVACPSSPMTPPSVPTASSPSPAAS